MAGSLISLGKFPAACGDQKNLFKKIPRGLPRGDSLGCITGSAFLASGICYFMRSNLSPMQPREIHSE
jgi:hypothetical protein